MDATRDGCDQGDGRDVNGAQTLCPRDSAGLIFYLSLLLMNWRTGYSSSVDCNQLEFTLVLRVR